MNDTRESFAARCTKAIDALRSNASIDVEAPEQPPTIRKLADPDWVFSDIYSRTGLQLPERFKEYFFAAARVHANWETNYEPTVMGEMCLTHIHRCMTAPSAPLRNPALNAAEQELLAELRIIDQEPLAGSGRVTGLRFTPFSEDPEVWLHDLGHNRIDLLDVDYCSYLDTALITKGTFGWQYLFAETSLGDREFGDIAANLRNMTEEFPTLFPTHDYRPLRDRLEARL